MNVGQKEQADFKKNISPYWKILGPSDVECNKVLGLSNTLKEKGVHTYILLRRKLHSCWYNQPLVTYHD